MGNLQQNLVISFKKDNLQDFNKFLYDFISLKFKREIYLIKNILGLEKDQEAISEIYVYFLEKKLPEIKSKFSKNISERHLLATINLALKNSAQDILMKDNVYNIKQRIRKDIKTYSSTSKIYKILDSNNTEIVKLIDKTDKIVQPEHKRNNLLGISGKDIEKVIKIVLFEDHTKELNLTVNLCFDYLIKNNYLRLDEEVSIDTFDSNGNKTSQIEIKDETNFNNESLDKELYSKIMDSILEDINSTLTEYQKTILSYILKDDISLTDIAEQLSISSQNLNYHKNTLFSLINKLSLKHLRKYDLEDDVEFFGYFIEKLKENF